MKKFFILSLFGVLLSLSSFAVSAITGPSAICVGNTATMMDSTAGGTWTSSNTAVATVGSATGIVNGVAAGIATISYITGTGTVTKTITVNTPPTAIGGSSTVCVGGTITLTDATAGGTWMSGNSSIATIGSATGVLNGVSAGVVNIYYSVGGCGTYKTVTVNAAPSPITGSSTVCVGSTITLNDSLSPGGTWTSASPAVATIGSTSGVVTGVAAGTSTIYYSVGGCVTYKVVTVTSTPAAISGASTLCVGSTITLTDATSGGTWASSVSTVATVGSTTGVVTGVAAGTSVIYYSVPGCGGAYKIVTVTAAPAAITGSSSVCVGSNITLADATPGGTWSSSSTSIAYVSASLGIVVGNSPGVATITYTISGCGSVTTTVTVNAAPGPITGSSTLCAGSTTTLTDSVSGGTWSSSNTAVATVGSTSGIVTGVAAGTATIYYVVGGCATYKVVTVTSAPAAISGASTVCAGSTITLTDATSGGTWASASSSVATVGSTTGVVTGVAAGTTTIYYSVPGCGGAYKIVTVTAAPAAITGSSTVCVGGSITLSDATSGGSWFSTPTSIATVGSTTGIVTGVAAGVATITYYIGGCGMVTTTVTVNAGAGVITGPSALCAGSTITLSDTVPGGTWSTSGTSVATVGSTTGIVTGVAAGTVNVYYLAGGCGSYKTLTVTASPAAISGSSTVCVGSTITLTDATGGGTWASSVSPVATVGSATGIVTGVAAGTTTIYYSVPGCGGAYKIVTVTAAPAAITGSSSVCVGSNITLADATSGGTWSSSSTSIAYVSASLGIVVGNAPGVATISYTVSGCGSVTHTVTVNTAPGPINGPSTLCVGSTITLTDSVTGGTWSTSGTSVATIGSSTGIVTGVAAGTVNVYYLMGGCGTYKILTVTAAPAAISGSSTVCVGSSITLTDATAGGTWASSATTVATVGSATGVVTGVAAGTSVVYYSVPGCGGAYKIVTVTAAPAAITGSSTVCVGSTITLADATPGGTWSSSATSIAYVSASLGIVYGSSAGVATITYSISGCGMVTKSVTVNPGAGTISGPSTLCVGSTITLTDTTSGGTWTSSNASVATVGSSTGIVTGVAAGTATIYYLVGGCGTYKIVTVTASPAAISGSSTVCVGSSISLTDATAGGTWASANTSVATVGSTTGVVTGVAPGTSTIYYSVPGCGGAYKIVTVNAPPAAIAGGSAVCVGHTLSLTDATAGGTWISGNTSLATVGSATGIVTGIAPGVLNIYYSVGGCGTYHTVTVNAVPTITSTVSSVCVGSSITLSASAGGGTWSSTSTHVSVGSATGVVTGISAGTAAVYYLVGGCGAYKIVTVSTCTGSIGGGITTGGPKGTSSGVPVVGMLVRLKYASTNAIVTQTYTDASGIYSFTGLADDAYYVYPEEAGYTTTPSATLTISGASAIFNDIDFKVHDGSRTIVPVTTAVHQVQNGGHVNVYPNPAQGSLYVGWSGQAMDGATVIMTDVTGREVSRTVINNSSATGEAQVKVSGLAAGVYLISVRSGAINYRTEILIQ